MKGFLYFNRKGDAGDFLDFGGFIFILVLITLGVVGGYSIFFSEYVFQQTDASVLFDRVEACFIEHDFFETEFNIYEICKLNDNVEENHLIYVKEMIEGKNFSMGVKDYITQCDLVDKKRRFAKCRKEIVMKNGHEFELIVGSNQNSRRVLT